MLLSRTIGKISAILIFGSICLAPRAAGQAVSARLEGLVLDQSRAIIPGVTVVALNDETGTRSEAVSNDSGRYVFPNLTPGSWTLSAERAGFKKVVTRGLILQIGDTRSQDLTLLPGDVSESVTVAAEAETVDTTTASIGAVVQNRQALDLPLNGRDAMMLFYLQSGTNPLDRVSSSQQQVGSVNGLDPNTSAIKVEGVLSINGGYDYSPAHPSTPVPQEAVGEYRVNTATDMADTGRGSGAQVKVMIKSGTNELHGSVFEFNRNTDYNANDFFSNRGGLDRPVLKRNQFGFALGGPIKKNKTFFFATAEWQRQIQESVENRVVYTPSARAGNFRYLIGGTNSGAIVDQQGNPTVPASQIGTINMAIIDPTRTGIDTVYLPKLLAQMPAPNNYDLGDGLNTGGYRYNSSNPDNYYQVLFKIDHELSANHHLSISASQAIENAPQPKLYNGISPEGFEERRRGASLRIVSILSPRLTNEFSIGANDRTSQRPITNPAQLTAAGNIQFVALGTGTSLAGGSNGNLDIFRSPQVNPAVTRGLQDEATMVRGNHTFSFGGEFWLQAMNRTIGTSEYPVLRTDNANNPATIPALPGLSSTDRAFAQQLTNDITGTIGSITQSFYLSRRSGFTPYQQNYEPLRKNEGSLFVMDVWKIRPNLGVNFGLRWEYLPPVYLANDVYVYPVGGVAGALGVQGPTGQPTQWGFASNQGKDIFNTQKHLFGPSIGISWDPFGNGRTAIRAAYRVAYDRFAMVNGDFSTNNYGEQATIVLTPFSRFTDPKLYGGILPVPTPDLFAPLPNIRQGNAYVADQNLGAPYVHLWNFSVEREYRGWKLNASYVGNHAVAMWRGINLNQVNMTSNGFLDAFRIAQSNLAANGNPSTGQSLGNLAALFRLIPSSQYNLITQGQAAALANYLDTTTQTTNVRGGLVTQAGLPATFFRYNPQVTNLYIVGNRSHSTFDGLELMAKRSLQKGVYFQANYTFGKALTDQLPGQTYNNDYRDIYNPRLDKSLSPFDSTHVFLLNGIWELPFGRGKAFFSGASSWKQALAGGWQLNGIVNFSSGRPMLITTNRNNLSQTVTSNPDFAGGFNNLGDVHKGGNQVTFITPQQAAAFTAPGPGQAGTLANYAFHGPGFSTFDVSLFKKFPLKFRESAQLQVRAEFFNVLNHPTFQLPVTANLNIFSGSFGVLTSAYPARIGQFAAKISF